MPQEEQTIKKVDIGDLTEVVTASVQRAIAAQGAGGRFPHGHIIIGVVFAPGPIKLE
jgi:hypothetical protein